ncbi:carbohydrate sulfotransferase 15 [Camelus ferus]|nr:carbohydrate sulfotransferase 15 [Camelus ferus]
MQPNMFPKHKPQEQVVIGVTSPVPAFPLTCFLPHTCLTAQGSALLLAPMGFDLQLHKGLAHGSVGQRSKDITMRHCINCCIQLSPDDTHPQQAGCRGGPHHGHQECPACKGENRIVFRVDDYPSIKLIINSITARIEFTTRQLPDVEDLKKQELHMFSVIPSKFLPNSKSPCWYEEFTGRNTTDPYLTNSYVLYSKRFRSTFDALRKAFWGHLSHANGKHFRLRCLPHFYIIGQPKCGTTDLYDRLRLHPEVKFSAIKEPHWWTRKRFGIVRLRDGLRDRYPVEDYLDLFDLAAHQIHQGLQASSTKEQSKINRLIIGEASASTMWDNNAWMFFYDNSTDGEPPFLTQDFIHAFQPDAKLIVMLRDPVERLYSDYLYFASSNKSADDFHEKVTEALQLFENCMLDYSLRACVYNNTLNNAMPVRLQVGLYAVYLLDWLTVFNKEQFLILRLEDHASNVKYTMHRVFQFLNLGPLSEKQEALMTKSPASNARRPEDRNLGPMWPVTQRILQDFYGPFNTQLARVLADEAFLWKKT